MTDPAAMANPGGGDGDVRHLAEREQRTNDPYAIVKARVGAGAADLA